MSVEQSSAVVFSGKRYPTYIDDRGVRRFHPNPLIESLFDAKLLDMNEVAIKYKTAQIN